MNELNFKSAFESATGHQPFEYQIRLACGERNSRTEVEWLTSGTTCASKLINIPTGLGKTAAVVMAWLWNRAAKSQKDWPRRLVYCLPMRTLVEQTRDAVSKWLSHLELTERIGIKVLMGGEDKTDWDIHPERAAILIGTQDMLLSRALNRGYGMSRYRWPMHFGLLNNDALWVMDETQLMGVAVETSAQLDAFRACNVSCQTWWMSATGADDKLSALREDSADEWNPAPPLTEEQRALIDRLVADGLAIQHKFKPEPLYKLTGKGHYESNTVDEIRRAREEMRQRDQQP